MKRTKMLKKIGTVVLSAALMVSMGALVFMTGDSGIVASAAGSTTSGTYGTSGGTWITPTQWVSTGTTGSSENKKDTQKSAEQRISGRMDQEIFNALSEGSSTVKIDGSQYGINSLSRDMIKQLSDSGLDAEFTFDYDGSHYVITIPAGETPISDDVPWFGPKYLIGLYGDTAAVTPIE